LNALAPTYQIKESNEITLLSESRQSTQMVVTCSKREQNLYKMLYLNVNTSHQWQRKHIKLRWLKRTEPTKCYEIWSSHSGVPEDSSLLFRKVGNYSPMTQRHITEYFRVQIKC